MFPLMAGGNRFHSVIKTHKWVALGVRGGLGSTAPSMTLGLWLLCVLWNRGTVLSLAFSFPALSVSRVRPLSGGHVNIVSQKRRKGWEMPTNFHHLSVTSHFTPSLRCICMCCMCIFAKGSLCSHNNSLFLALQSQQNFYFPNACFCTWFTCNNPIHFLVASSFSMNILFLGNIILHWRDVVAQGCVS